VVLKHIRAVAAAAVVAASLALVPAAAAGPPTLLTVTQANGVISATWSLPPDGAESSEVEIATDPAVDADGHFRWETAVVYDALDDPAQTSYTWPLAPLPAGTYYVHVSSLTPDPSCPADAPVCLLAFSNILAVTIPHPPPPAQPPLPVPPPPPPLLPPPPNAVKDSSVSFSKVTAASSQKLSSLRITASLPEAGTITVAGSVSVPGAAKVFKFKTARKSVAAGASVTLKPKLAAKAVKAVKRALKRGKRLKAKLTITARDKVGNSTTFKKTVKLKR
jgi:hypothetical protein